MVQRSRPGSPRRPGQGSRPGAQGRASPGARPGASPGARPGSRPVRRVAAQPARGGTPPWAWLIVIGLPLAGILGLVVLQLTKTEEEPQRVVDPNEKFRELQKEIPAFEKELRAVFKLVRSEDPTARARGSQLRDRMESWMAEWDSIIEPLRDQTGELAAEYKGYEQVRGKVNTLRQDLLKFSGFD